LGLDFRFNILIASARGGVVISKVCSFDFPVFR
jgi:hypothetical protein